MTGVCTNVLIKYLQLYRKGGLDEIRKLEKYSDSIEQYFRENPVASSAEAIVKIEELTGIRRSKTQVRIFLRKHGMRHRNV